MKSSMKEKLNQILNDQYVQYEKNTPNSHTKHIAASKVMPGGNTRTTQWMDPYPFFVDNAEGMYINDIDNNNYLDFMLNATTLILGHTHPEIVKTLTKQVQEGTVYSVPTEGQSKLADILVEIVPSFEKVRFTNSGTEATMMAIMAARSFTKKTKIAKFEGGYHGTHDHVSVSVYPKKEDLNIYTHPGIPEYSYQPKSILDDVIVLPYNNIEKSKELISIHKEDLACVIMEPIISNFGYLPLDIEFIRFIRDITEEASNNLNEAIIESINSDPNRHLGFYNRANNLSLKYHAFQLLPGIGNSKAIQMVKERGGSGWSSFEQIDGSCGIESVRLLAERYLGEMNDPSESPSLLELLVRSEI